MKKLWIVMASLPLFAVAPTENHQEIAMKRLTPVLYVEEIEPAIAFWERLGFQRANEVNEGDRLGFISFESGPVQIMYQTRASVVNDAPELADSPMGGSMLFIEVDDIDSVAEALGDTEYLVPRRTTFYGAEEIIVREPGGNIVNFAHFAAEGG